jgi:acetylornithine deacetylase/succinyl-diaminopimelate desuccinylase-like protein
MNPSKIREFIEPIWDNSITPTLCEYIKIPNKSPAYDPDWQQNGYTDKAVDLIVNWCKQQNVIGMQLQVHRAEDRTPLIMMEIAGQSDETILLYGHLDKQPEMTGWNDDLGPWKPVLKNNRLYGRGSADDGYAAFAAITAIKTLQEQKIPHARCVILIEACEESGSRDLPYYIEELKTQIGSPNLVICLDSGCGNYKQFWTTTSLRGVMGGILDIEILKEGVHSGAASGVVPSTFRILRQLLSRIEDENTGEILLPEFHVTIPQERIAEAESAAEVLGDEVWQEYSWVEGAKPVPVSNAEKILNRTWRPTLSITGAEGLPGLSFAGNVLRPRTAVMLSLRIPPTCDAEKANHALKQVLESNPPFNAKISFEPEAVSVGWNAPAMQPWLIDAVNQASQNYYGKKALFWGEGGSIPFMGMLGKRFPQAQFVITGVLGPQSNAHGPNEFLELSMAKNVTCCIAEIVAKHYKKG